MYIRIYKNINSSAAKELRKAHQKIDFFSKHNNSDFLFEEFPKDDEYHIFDYVDKKDENHFEIRENLGSYTFPKYLFSKSIHNLIFSLNWDSEHKYENIYFSISFRALKSDEIKRSCRIELYATWDEDTNNKKFNFYLQNSDIIRDNIIYNIPLCFYNNREIYEKIYFFLIKNKKEMCKVSGNKDFVKDLTSLFSVKKTSTTPFNLQISNSNKEKEFVIYDGCTLGIYDKEGIRDDFTTLSYFDNIHRIGSEIKGIEEVALRVGKKNDILITDFIFGHSSLDFLSSFGIVGDTNINSIKNNEKLDDFLNLYLKDWLNNYILFSNFTSEVYSKVESKILVNSMNR